MSFSRPELLVLVFLAPALAAVLVTAWVRRRRFVAMRLADPELLDRLGGDELLRFPRLRTGLLAGAAMALGLAAAGPRWGLRPVEGRATARSVVLAADVSKSMLATDVSPNRLEQQRLFARRLLREMPGDRIGLVAFAGRAYVLSPLTVDESALSLYIDALDPGIVSQGGSSLASAISQSADLARGATETGGDRAVILVSDGEALEDEAAVVAAAERAARAGVTVFTVGVGTKSGAPVPEIDALGNQIGYKRDESGGVVVSHKEPALLQRIADRTGGVYVDLEQPGATARLLAALDRVGRSATEDGRRVEPRERQGLFLSLALLLVLLDTFLELSRRGVRSLRPAAAFALLIMTLAAGIGDVERGNRLYRAGRFAEAAEAYEAALRRGDDSRELRYNLGTSLLRLGRYSEAEPHFRAALDAVDPDLRERTFYNLGNRFLQAARQEREGARQGPLLEAAIEAYRRALRLNPGDAEAKWNLELALREDEERRQQMGGGGDQPEPQDPQEQESGGSGSGAASAAPQSPPPQRAGEGASRTPLTREQADRVLSAVEQDERELTREKLRKGQRQTPVRRDW